MTVTIEDNSAPCEADHEGEPPRPFQAQSYSDLLQFPAIPIGDKSRPSGTRDITVPVIDAIVVPTLRSAEQISAAAELAAHARCKLITLYTDDFPAGLSSALGRLRPGTAIPLALPRGLKHHLLDLAADLPQSLVSSCAVDISRKRNLGLLLGRTCGWSRMLFLDDDIRRLSVPKLSSAAALLDKYPVVGLQVNKYPDASVVGHARRLTGRRQEPFVSGGSLLVNPQRLDGFFPPIYHEDWLCIISHLRRGEVAGGGTVGQLPYKPFTTPERARLEEFGDILVPSLLWLVQARARTGTARPADAAEDDYWQEATDPRFWEQILRQRAVLLEDIALRLNRISLPDPSPLPSVRAARQRCGELTPEEFASFTEKWLTSLGVWRDRLSSLPRAASVEKALADLGLWHAVRACEPGSQRATARGTRWSGGFAGRWGRRAAADGRRRFALRSGRLTGRDGSGRPARAG